MTLWQRLLDRIAPILDDEPSRLDRLDGVRAPAPSRDVLRDRSASRQPGLQH